MQIVDGFRKGQVYSMGTEFSYLKSEYIQYRYYHYETLRGAADGVISIIKFDNMQVNYEKRMKKKY
jgi:hypothetical protein